MQKGMFVMKKMFVMKRTVAVVLCMYLLMLLGGCGIEQTAATTAPSATTTVLPNRETETTAEWALDIYYLQEPIATAKNMISQYASANPDLFINATAFESIEEMDAQITSDLERGNGPDVILFTDATQLDTVKLALNDHFIDLSGMLEEDISFRAENYYPVLESGVIGGGQYLIPLRMRLMYMMTTQESFTNDLALDEAYTLKQLMQALGECADRCAEEENAMHTMHSFDSYLYDLLRITGIQIVDVDELTQTVSEDMLMEYAVFAQLAYSQCLQAAMDMREYGTDNIGEMLSRNTAILIKESMPANLRYFAAAYSKGLEQEIQLITYPNQYNARELIADISLYAAVINTTDNLPGAYSFIRSAMDNSVGNINEQLPVSRACVEALLATLGTSSGKMITVNSKVVMVDKISEEQKEVCRSLLNRISQGSIANAGVRKIISDGLGGFIMMEKDFDSCYQEIVSELACYLEELYDYRYVIS